MFYTQLRNAYPDRFEFYKKFNELYESKLEKVKPLVNDESSKKFLLACQKAIKEPVNAISAASSQHLNNKFDKIYDFITGHPFKVAEGIISINDHPLGPDYCLLLLTKLFVEQGDVLIGSVSQAAFGIASIIVSLWKVLPEFGALFLATLYKESPYLVPYYVTKQTQQSTEDYLKTLGYKFKKGMLENQEQFLKRQTGYARLFSAIMITSGRKIDEQPHPFGKEHCWSWLTNFINMEPFPNVSTTILYEVLKTVSANLYETYGKQFLKLIIFIRHTYIPKVKEINSDGLTVRLEVLLDEYLKTKSFKMPLGFLSKDFW